MPCIACVQSNGKKRWQIQRSPFGHSQRKFQTEKAKMKIEENVIFKSRTDLRLRHTDHTISLWYIIQFTVYTVTSNTQIYMYSITNNLPFVCILLCLRNSRYTTKLFSDFCTYTAPKRKPLNFELNTVE